MDPTSKTAVLHPWVGQTFKQYRIDSLLGQGGMGVVYRAHDLKLQRPVAVKLLSPELTADPDRRKRFFLEARAAARLTHPAIAQVYDVDEEAGAIFIAMELVEGQTVRELIRGQELDLLGALDIALQVAGGLAKAHEAGIVHRDIKPANVICAPDGHVKILDFGLAKLVDPSESTTTAAPPATELSTLTQTQAGAVKGTPAYMSPEQVKAEKVDVRSDLFSLGVMLFEMATGEAPFQRGTMVETLHAVAFDDPPSLRTLRTSLPPGLQRIVSRCLQKRPEDRYPDARALIEDLRVLRRDTETAQANAVSLRERFADTLDRLRHLRPAQYAWLGGGLVALSAVGYLVTAGVNWGRVLFVATVGLLGYRYVRHQPRRVQEAFVRSVARIPEVRVIRAQDADLTVVVERATSRLYGRINTQLSRGNRKLLFGRPMSVAIRHDLTPEELRQLLNSPGVRYVREDPPENT